jgi:ELWxxDGT repeat protein
LLAAGAACVAAPAPLLVDINTGNGPIADSSPGDAARLTATQTVFSAWDPVHGRELWISDGSAANTHLLADICPGACSSSPHALNPADALTRGVLYLSADDGRIGAELWKVTAAGVVSLVADINPGALGSNPGDMVFPNQTSTMPGYFAATAAATGRELYRTDGTAPNTFLIKDVTPGPGSTSPLAMGAGRTRVFFSGRAPDEGFELYVSDGTADGTAVRAIIRPGTGSSSPGNFIQWQNDTMLFKAFDETHGTELWITTASTTALLADIAPGTDSSLPDAMTAFGGRIFFRANDGTHGTELWSTDATSDGTMLFEDLRTDANSDSSFPTSLVTLATSAGPRLLFIATPSGNSVPRLFVSDGSVGGTAPLDTTGLFIFSPAELTVSGALAYFADFASDSILRTDGTSAGTILIHDFGNDFPDAGIRLLAPVGSGKMLLSLTNSFIGNEPYVSGPSSSSAAVLANIAPDLGSADPRDLTDVQGTLYFSAFAEGVGRELWKASDPALGAELVADIVPGAASSDPDSFVALGARLLFVAESVGSSLFVSDSGGTAQLVPTDTGESLLGVQCLAVVGNRAYFYAESGGDGGEPWTSDGTPSGTHRIDVQPGAAGGEGTCQKGEPAFAVAGANVLFGGTDTTRGLELFRTTGTAPVFVRDINVGNLSSLPADLGAFGSRACFAATTFNESAEPWCSDGTAQGTVPLGDLLPGSVSSQPHQFVQVGNLLVFSATAADGRTVWRSDGTAAGTQPIASAGTSLIGFPPIEPGEFVVHAPALQHVANRIFFPCPGLGEQFCVSDVRPGHGPVFVAGFADDAGGVADLHAFPGGDVLMSCATNANGRELCLYDSISADIAATIVDIAPGAASSSPREIAVSAGRIWFSADDGTHGRELWALPLAGTIDRIFVGDME